MTFLLCVMYILLFALVTIINYLLTYLHHRQCYQILLHTMYYTGRYLPVVHHLT